jgi:cobaltochelatase CobT
VLRREADPRASDRVWFATPPPARRWAAVSLLVDLSGSMRGEKVEAAKLGAEACALALSAVGVTFALQGFQDVLIPLLPFGAHRPAAILRATAALEREVRGDRPQGNNRPENNDDGPCLNEAAAALARRTEPERLLVVISDGLPEGSRSTPDDLHAAVRRWTAPRSPVRVVALGLGPRTAHVRDFYPDAIAEIEPEALPRALAEALGRRLRRAG